MQVSHRFTPASAVFDDDSLVSCAGLVPVMTLAAQTGLPTLLADKIDIAVPRIKSGSANPSPKLTTVIAGMCAGADSIDDLDVVRSGGMKALFEGVYATSSAPWSGRRNRLHQPKRITADHWNYLRLWADCGHGVGTHGFCPSATGQSDGCRSDNC